MADIDIDFYDKSIPLNTFHHINAMMIKDNKLLKHPSGIYVQSIPHNPINNLCNIDFKEAELRGYFKIDFLNVNVYKGIKNKQHLKQLMEIEPVWELLKNENFVQQLFHLNTHIDTLKLIQPTSVEQLAATLAMIRPAKKYLIGKDWNTIMTEIWTKSDDAYYFKKSHAIALAYAIIVQMNLLTSN